MLCVPLFDAGQVLHLHQATTGVKQYGAAERKPRSCGRPKVKRTKSRRAGYKSNIDPARLVDLFPPLKLRKGYQLRAYLFREGGNGNGVVWAMPEDAPFPEPNECPTLENHLFKHLSLGMHWTT